MLRARTPRELEDKLKKLKRFKGILSGVAGFALITLVLLVAYSIWMQYHDIYDQVSLAGGYPTSWAGGVYRIEAPEGEKVSMGTGFSIGPQLVISNAHVVKRKEARVKLFTDRGKEFIIGEVLWVGDGGKDALKDIAIINIGKKLARDRRFVLPLYRGDDLKVGEDVTAIGFNQGQPHVTCVPGNVTSLGREDGLIQHNAAVNFGFSGAPLISKSKKQVVGLVVAQEDRVEKDKVYTGIKMAIPIKVVLRNLPQGYLSHIGIQ